MDAIYTTYLLDLEAGGGANDRCPDELQDFIHDAQDEEHIVHNWFWSSNLYCKTSFTKF